MRGYYKKLVHINEYQIFLILIINEPFKIIGEIKGNWQLNKLDLVKEVRKLETSLVQQYIVVYHQQPAYKKAKPQ